MRSAWMQMGVGIWVLVSPWILGVSGVRAIVWSNLAVGLALILVNLWTIFGEEKAPLEEDPLPAGKGPRYNGRDEEKHIKKQ